MGRVLKQASDQSIKDGARIANYRIFYEADDELLSQALYANSYARDASSPVGSWMLVATRGKGLVAAPALTLVAPAAGGAN